MSLHISKYVGKAMENDILNDIHNALVDAERVQLIPAFPPSSIYAQCRQTIVVWMIEVCEAIATKANAVCFQACYFLDRVFLNNGLDDLAHRGKFQLFAMACIWIAMKFAESEDVRDLGKQLVDYSNDAYKLEDLVSAEHAVLTLLDWRANLVTPNCFLGVYMSQLTLHRDVHSLTILLLGLALQQHHFMIYAPSILASAALQCAGHLVYVDGDLKEDAFAAWSAQVVNISKLSIIEVSPCAQLMYEAYNQFAANHARVISPMNRMESTVESSCIVSADCEVSSLPSSPSDTSSVGPMEPSPGEEDFGLTVDGHE
jgi:hypothetical protein